MITIYQAAFALPQTARVVFDPAGREVLKIKRHKSRAKMSEISVSLT